VPLPVYTVRLGAIDIAAGGQHTFFTVPADATYVLKDIEITNGDADPHQLWVQVTAGAGLVAYIYRVGAASPTASIHWEGTQALEAGELLQAGTTGTNATFIASGWKLSL